MKIIVLGGDGFCGWPTALYLSKQGHDIVIVDNLSRRKIDIDLEVDSLTPIASMSDRLEAWKETPVTSLLIAGNDSGVLRTMAELVL